ncbi:N-acetylglutaminylglutamine amidotransferase [Micromonospora ureilytica]|uniref:asparagine synthase (glutamine-hydrolyzing) n=1 Tax=Micromonospora ureilytica TaxID=709868 RepID=A0A3N9YEI6_9ACTN|nr:N-acetylglutaminylglutamine amidotransferase [Micromonospora ureilytica]RQX18483.1 N-acetylglutaminylglutamine amidotransferase [Micromonospora ureilytica]
MCGFGGEFRLDGAPADLAAVERMLSDLTPRGPDGEGRWQQGPAALVHRRLRIIDLSDAGAQPMVDPELGLAMVFNGCVYNYRELRDELTAAGYSFRSTSDTEVILKAYHRWGTACVERFHGMFAFALVELATHTLVLARDRLGIKPLYLAETPGRVRFASTLPALLAAGDVNTDLDPVALHHYMSFHSVVPPPRTILAGVRKLPPATVRVITADGRSTDTTYWRPEFNRAAALAMSADEWQERLMAALRTAVRRRMVADVPVGVLLSGGLDSSLIVALLAEQGQTGLATFSIGFEAAAGESGDEFHYSDRMARHFGTDHQQIRIGAERFVPAVHRAIAAMSEPMVSHDCVAFHLLSEEVSQRITVVQSGQGADEILAGYDWYPPMANVARADAVEAYARVFFDRRHDALGGHLAPEWMLDHDASLEFVTAHFGAPGADTALDAALRLDSLVMLVDDPVKRVDNMTMAWGLEARVPFLDHEVVELAAACPPAMKLAQGGKGVLKAASRGIVPDEVIDRPKGYFPVPAIRHLSGPLLDDVRDALTARPARERGLFRKDYLEELLDAPNARRTTLGSNALWQLGLLELWLQRIGV